MGFLSGLMGNASEVDTEKLQAEFESILFDGETITQAYQVIRDMFVFTEYRLIIVDRQGVTGKKVEYHTIPFKSISQFAVETAGTFDMDTELKIWVSSAKEPLVKQFKSGTNIVAIQKAIAQGIFTK
ncbi:PH domain-containing protein [Neiella marina]|uniref:PH domain-containing protein n=1 Tax=Neiella holothuriorum TaxID=2870530 RepID=A0ABS7EJF8_9GAMM|nr:PH domain-containing protein [Neiella holothuriorum]MBW8192460.1 PH domain-containing protein [Neiella holothuriorum]